MQHRAVQRGAVTRRGLFAAGLGAAATLGLASCTAQTHSATSSGPAPGAASDAPTIMIIRHAEKPADAGAPFGVLPDESQDAESLTIAGWTRAGALIGLFNPQGTAGAAPLRAGIGRPARVIAADPSRGSRRPDQTVSAIAARLGLAVETTWKKNDAAALATVLRATTVCTLVAWEHELIPEILSHLGRIDRPPRPSWPGDRFDLVWCLRRSGTDVWSFSQVPQLLLAGDTPAPA